MSNITQPHLGKPALVNPGAQMRFPVQVIIDRIIPQTEDGLVSGFCVDCHEILGGKPHPNVPVLSPSSRSSEPCRVGDLASLSFSDGLHWKPFIEGFYSGAMHLKNQEATSISGEKRRIDENGSATIENEDGSIVKIIKNRLDILITNE